ncbi:ATP synthase F1 subunit gamma [Flavobacteriales bacterium]|jgi:F-type H+-transporting ATPase subunit gamma|nr:ATP synthase F1 subunit gamma [Flavobacteriales bacterium]
MAGGLKEVRERITSVQNTMQITSAMKMVAAAKLRRAQDAITRMRPYAEKLQGVLSNVSASLDSSDGVYSQQRDVKRVLIVAITSNRGLCGGFNNNIIKAANTLMQDEGVEYHVLPLGKKAYEAFLKRSELKAVGFDEDAWKIYDDLNFERAQKIGEDIMTQFVNGQYDDVKIVYNRFVNAAVQDVTTENFLPLVASAAEDDSAMDTDYLFEPSQSEIVEQIIPSSLKVQLYKGILDSNAAEHGARMTAMHQATENAGDMLRDLRISYNKARQASITTEILEIVAGSEALSA